MRIESRVAVGIAALMLLGCPSEKPQEAPDAAVAVIDAGVVEVVDAGPPAPLRLEFAVTASSDAGETPLAFSDESPTDVDAVTALQLTTPVRLKDYRVRLFDWNDQVVTSDDAADLGDGGLSYRIELPEPLKTGRRYSVLVDAELAPEITDEAGRTYDDVRLDLKVRGEIVVDKKPAKKSKKSRK